MHRLSKLKMVRCRPWIYTLFWMSYCAHPGHDHAQQTIANDVLSQMAGKEQIPHFALHIISRVVVEDFWFISFGV